MFTSGKNNILDLTSPEAIPVRFTKAMTHLSSDLQLPLSLTYTTEEKAILTKTIRAMSLNDIQGIVKDIRLVPRVGLKKLTAMYQVNLEDSISFLSSNNDGMFYRDDSPISDDTSNTSTSSDIMEMERVRRILKLTTDKANAIGLDDDLLSCEDWEDLLVLDENGS